MEFPLHLLVDKDQGNDLGFTANKSNRLQQRLAKWKYDPQGTLGVANRDELEETESEAF